MIASWRDYLKTGALAKIELPWFHPDAIRFLLELLGGPVPNYIMVIIHRQEPLGAPISTNPVMSAWWGYGPARQLPIQTAVFAVWIAGLSASQLPGRALYKFPMIGGQLWVAYDPGERCWRLFLHQWHYRFRVSLLRFSSEALAVIWAERFIQMLQHQWGHNLQHVLDRWAGEDPRWFDGTPEGIKNGWIGCMCCSIRAMKPSAPKLEVVNG